MPDSAMPAPPGVRAILLGGKHALGRVAWVDEWNYDRAAACRWSCWEFYRAGRLIAGPYPQARDRATGEVVLMHNFITGRKHIDHRNGDGLDCRESNLRDATKSQNAANTGKLHGQWSSRYKGVGWAKRERRWRARIRHHKQEYGLGYFRNEEDAARAVDEAAQRLFGEYAWLNRDHFPELRAAA